MNRGSLALLVALLAGGAAGCRPAVGTTPEPRRLPPGALSGATLPGVDSVFGALTPRVVYPTANQMIQSRDSNFVFGSLGNGRATLAINGTDVRVWPNGAFLGWVPNPPPTSPQYVLVARIGDESIVVTHPVRVAGMTPPVPDSLRPPPPVVTDTTPTWVVLSDTLVALSDTDRVVIGRPTYNSTYRWFLLPGTRVQLTGRYSGAPGFARVRLDSGLDIWVEAVDARTLASDTTPPRRVAGNVRVRAAADWVDVAIPIGERPAYLVEQRGRGLDLTLYGTRGNTDLVTYPTSDSLVRRVEWSQVLNDRAMYRVELGADPFGYQVLYEGGVFTLRVRRPPPALANVRARRSALAGLTIAVDAGHPPAGATGPTGLYEADAALSVADSLRRMLEARGASVVMTRTTRDAVDLAMRPVIARREHAHAFVSLHYNGYPDGVNPFTRANGAEVYFYRAHSEPLARAVQSAVIERQPLADQGIHFRSLAVVRSTWYPSILVEGGFMMIPEQEQAMRTPAWHARFAAAVTEGLERYFSAVRNP